MDDTRQAVTEVSPEPGHPVVAWLRQNLVQLGFIAAIIVLVCRFLHPFDVLLAGLGLSLIVFIHELGHFAAAKLCDVRVTTFSIGFGPALPFCSFKYGETNYKIALIPLGGYVAMSGETSGEIESQPNNDEEPEEEANDPRNFKNKPVWQRMIIISAGVIMNIILGAACFVGAYLNGVKESPALLAGIEPGSAAWQAGLRPNAEIVSLNERTGQWFDDIRPTVISTGKGEQLRVEVRYGNGPTEIHMLEPRKPEGALYPTLGIAPLTSLNLYTMRRDPHPPYEVNSPASLAKALDGSEGFRPGDRIIAMSDVSDPKKVTPFDPVARGFANDHLEYLYRMDRLAGQPVLIQVQRRGPASEPGTTATIEVAPAYRKDAGWRFRMGPIVSIRENSPAHIAGLQMRQADGETQTKPGDEIVAVEMDETDGTVIRYTTDKAENISPNPKRVVKPLDPLRLPWELERWADRLDKPGKVRLTVLRDQEPNHTPQRVEVTLDWDPKYRFAGSQSFYNGTPMPINGLGLAYRVQAVLQDVIPGSPAAQAGLQANDQITEVRVKVLSHTGEETWGSWNPVNVNHAVYLDYWMQSQPPHTVEVRIKRDDKVVSVTAVPDSTWPIADRGLLFLPEKYLQKADSITEALSMGFHRTMRSVRQIYQGLYGMIAGRISIKLMSGPISMGRIAYIFAGRDFWELVLWVGLISINLAVVNSLPIPVLDGGHMVFLIYEAIRGKPAPESVHIWLSYGGLAIVLSLMVFVIGLDIWRLIFW